MKFRIQKEIYSPGTEPLYVVHGPGLEPMGIAFVDKVDASSCRIACLRVWHHWTGR